MFRRRAETGRTADALRMDLDPFKPYREMGEQALAKLRADTEAAIEARRGPDGVWTVEPEPPPNR